MLNIIYDIRVKVEVILVKTEIDHSGVIQNNANLSVDLSKISTEALQALKEKELRARGADNNHNM